MANNQTRAENSLSEQLRQLNLNSNNIVDIMNAIQEAITSDKVSVPFTIKHPDGTETTIQLPTNTSLYNELKIVLSNQKQILGLNESGQKAVVFQDGVRRSIVLSSYDRMLQNWQNITRLEDVKLLNKSIVMNFMNPVSSVAFDLPSNILSTNQVFVKKITVSKEFITNNTNEFEYYDLIQALRNSDTVFKEYEDVYDTEPRVQRFYGNFDVLKITPLDNGTSNVELESLNYSDTESISNTRELDAGDYLTNAEGTSKYLVTSVNKTTKVANVKRVGGFDAISVGVKQLNLTVDIENEQRRLHVPINGNSYQYVFLAPVNVDTSVRTELSKSYRIDSDELVVIEDSARLPFNAYFNQKVQNIGSYLSSLIEESTIPLSLGIKPDRPQVDSSFFQVVQVNEHLMDNTDIKKINQMLTEKSKVYAQIVALENSIRDISSRINAGKYKSAKERSQDRNELQKLSGERNDRSKYYDSLISDIASKTQNEDLTTLKPKYRIRGFWPVQEPIFSENSRPQNIISYLVQYRYLSPTKANTSSQRLTYTDQGKELVGSFTDWNIYPSVTLKKVKNIDGSYVWDAIVTEDSDKTNINQLDIPIRAGEKVQIRIKAISEAGYPVSGLESDWSEIITVDFPNDLLNTTDVIDQVKSNFEDLKQVQINELFRSKGIDEHLATSFVERDKYFAHSSQQIASGFLTNEQTTISLFDYLTKQANDLTRLEELLSKRMANLSIDIVDGDTQQSYSVQKNATINLFGGYYTEKVDLSEASNFGDIVRKLFYIRITNKSAITAELLSTSPGVLSNDTTNNNYNVIGVAISEDTVRQKNGQVLYLRKNDISSSIPLYSDDFSLIPTTIPLADIVAGAVVTEHNAVHINNSGDVESVQVKADSVDLNWVALSINHPFVIEWKANPNTTTIDRIKTELQRVSRYNQVHKAPVIQNAYNASMTAPYNVNDKHIVGYFTTGSKFFMSSNTFSSIQVASSDAGAVRELHPGDSNALLIPIVMQYRMTDALGRPNGVSTNSLNDTFDYNKLIGIDMIINNEPFRFDLNVQAKFRSTTLSNHDISIDKVNLVNQFQTGNTSPQIS
ncbi:gp264 [Sphingomonas phage PAU]|uniref:gp264 n=1 Tax=Sphingomonas phage PAU TaxID=1150991 RepID=UPI000257340E|nr:gp264 [Sphingomonas phage PAU]AFF28262.1 gp264 [Sphingomonas phage PAU]